MCSYNAPESLMPPLEMLSCAGVARQWNNAEVQLIDAISEKLSLPDTQKAIGECKPDIIVSLTGFECFEQDMDFVREVKQQYPQTVYVLFGHFATQFPHETIKHSHADYVVLGEPEMIFSDLLNSISGKLPLAQLNGVAVNSNSGVTILGAATRIKRPNELPLPAIDLIKNIQSYYEPLVPRPYGMIQTLRGCPYNCYYCVKSYGSKLSQSSVERIVEEIQLWQNTFGVKSIRFIDDTFTINRQRVIELCKAIIEHQLNIVWVCLSRADNLDKEMLEWMQKSGCMRIYFGLESGSQHMLDVYQKDIKVEVALSNLLLCREVGIETAGFFLGGHAEETESDFEDTIRFACKAKLNYVAYSPLTPYPGTPYYELVKNDVEFSLYPYVNRWKQNEVYTTFDKRKDSFYKAFYFRPSYMVRSLPLLSRHFGETLHMGVSLLRYLFWDKQFIIGGLKGANDK